MGKPSGEGNRTFNSQGFREMSQTLSLWTVTDYGEVRSTGSQQLRRTAQGEIARLQWDEAPHKEQLQLPITRGGKSLSFLEQGGIDANLCRNEKQLFPMHSELRVRV